MKVLIVEDDEDKRQKIVDLVRSDLSHAEILEARSFQSGLRSVEELKPDIIILDMTMRNYDKSPTEDGGRPHHFAGREILRQMKREGIRTPAVVITQFDEFGDDENKVTLGQLKIELKSKFPNYRGVISYRHHIDAWKHELSTALNAMSAECRE